MLWHLLLFLYYYKTLSFLVPTSECEQCTTLTVSLPLDCLATAPAPNLASLQSRSRLVALKALSPNWVHASTLGRPVQWIAGCFVTLHSAQTRLLLKNRCLSWSMKTSHGLWVQPASSPHSPVICSKVPLLPWDHFMLPRQVTASHICAGNSDKRILEVTERCGGRFRSQDRMYMHAFSPELLLRILLFTHAWTCTCTCSTPLWCWPARKDMVGW